MHEKHQNRHVSCRFRSMRKPWAWRTHGHAIQQYRMWAEPRSRSLTSRMYNFWFLIIMSNKLISWKWWPREDEWTKKPKKKKTKHSISMRTAVRWNYYSHPRHLTGELRSSFILVEFFCPFFFLFSISIWPISSGRTRPMVEWASQELFSAQSIWASPICW